MKTESINTCDDKNDLSDSISRRSMLRKLGVSVAGASLFAAMLPEAKAAQVQPLTAGPVRGIYPVFDVTVYGAVGDGSTNDSSAIQNAINAAQLVGGIVWFPPATYLLGTGLSVTNQVILAGAGWNIHGTKGSFLEVNNTSVTAITVAASATGVIIRDLGIFHVQPTIGSGWSPSNYPPAIQVSGTDTYLCNLFLQNPTYGISVSNSSGTVGRVVIEHIWGQPLKEGITIDNAQDVIKVDNIHFWPFWSTNSYVSSYILSSAIAIHSYRNDNPHFTRLFTYGYQTGILFDTGSTGVTSKFRVSNADFDLCNYGIRVIGAGTTGQIDNFTVQGPSGGGVSGLLANANNVIIQASNVRVSNELNNGIRITGTGTVLFFENTWIASWNISGSGFPGIEAVSPATVYVGYGRLFQSGNGASNTGGTGTVNLDS
jgi:hypothetical protein